jgi:tetratricopeptide (TPR) repeat protein
LSWAVHFLWICGYPDQAQRAAQEQVDLARQLGHPFNLAFSLTTGCAALVQRGETAVALQWINEAQAIGKQNAIGYVTHFFVPLWIGILQITQRQYTQGYDNLTSAWQYFEAGDGVLLAPLAGMMKAIAAMNLNRFDESRALLAEALRVINETDHRMHEAEVHRILGELERKQSNLAAAERCYLQAIEVSRSQSARGFELRASTSLARLWQEQGRCEKARGLLAPVYHWFSEGASTRDLVEADALLQELEASMR